MRSQQSHLNITVSMSAYIPIPNASFAFAKCNNKTFAQVQTASRRSGKKSPIGAAYMTNLAATSETADRYRVGIEITQTVQVLVHSIESLKTRLKTRWHHSRAWAARCDPDLLEEVAHQLLGYGGLENK